jgi:hypothetical protein
MATVKQYALQLWSLQSTVAAKMGTDIRSASLELRAALLAADVTLAVVLKVLNNNGAFTDAQLSSLADTVAASSFPPLPGEIHVPDDATPVPPPDLGA